MNDEASVEDGEIRRRKAIYSIVGYLNDPACLGEGWDGNIASIADGHSSYRSQVGKNDLCRSSVVHDLQGLATPSKTGEIDIVELFVALDPDHVRFGIVREIQECKTAETRM